ncbi:MAG: VCBS repeat-containing protein [Bacteroidota bacterium]
MLIALRAGTILGLTLFITTSYAQMTFPWTRHTIDNTSFGADGTKTYFANQDSLPDIISGWEQGGITRLYLHPGTPTQKWPYVEVKSPAVEDALLADLDEDGFPDIITFSEGQHQRITIHWAPNDWQQYQQSSAWESVDIPCTVDYTQWMFGVAHQVDGKYGLDLIVGSKNENGTLGWLESPANPREIDQWQFYEISPAGWIMSIETVDVNQDDYSDILISDRKGANRGVRWLEHPAEPEKLRAQWSNHIIGLTQGEPMFLTMITDPQEEITNIYVPNLSNHIIHFASTSDSWTQDGITFPSAAGTRGK